MSLVTVFTLGAVLTTTVSNPLWAMAVAVVALVMQAVFIPLAIREIVRGIAKKDR